MQKFRFPCANCGKESSIIVDDEGMVYIAATIPPMPIIHSFAPVDLPLKIANKPIVTRTIDPEIDVPANKLEKRPKEQVAAEVQRLKAEGKNQSEVAIELKISPITVEKLWE